MVIMKYPIHFSLGGAMKWCKYVIALSIFASARLSMGSSMDTMDLIGGNSGNFSIGWYGEAWKVSDWCGNVHMKDPSPDTIINRDTLRDLIRWQIEDTLTSSSPSQFFVDTLTVTTTNYISQIVAKHPSPDTLVDMISVYTTIIDSSIVWNCFPSDFTVIDSNGFTAYIDYYYKFRNYYAQLPIIWDNWQGKDSATVSGHKYLLITYKGILPTHFAKLEFIYAAWGANKDTTKDPSRGDGVGTLMPSPDGWTTITIQIPDSVSLPGITGLVLGIANQPNMGGKTSEVGNIKIERISLIKTDTSNVATRYQANRTVSRNNRFYFTPTSGSVTLCSYSLKGEALVRKTVNVRAGKRYSVRQFVAEHRGAAASQIRLVTIKGEGVNSTMRMW